MRKTYRYLRNHILHGWRMFWLQRSGPRGFGRVAAMIVSAKCGPYHQRAYLADLSPRGFIAASAVVRHPALRLGEHVYLGDNVVVTSDHEGGPIHLENGVHLYGDTFVESGRLGTIRIGAGTHVQPGCHFHSQINEIRVGRGVEVAARCAFYNYDHGTAPGVAIMNQPLKSKGGIFVGDGAWLGHGVTVLQGVTIGAGAVIAAGAVVVHDIPENAIAAGVPARVVGHRSASGEAATENKITPITTSGTTRSTEPIRKVQS